jgi:rubredoxin
MSPTSLEPARDDRWVCVNCGFLYDPEVADPARGFPAGTPFEALPEGWVCPLCYSDRSAFDRY